MTKTEVLALLKEHQNDRGIAHWKRLEAKSGLKSFGLGLTQQRKLAKEIGRDHKLAKLLWKSNVYDAKVIGLLIDDPKCVTREQAEEQVEELGAGLLAHVFASCDATLAKTDFVVELANNWMDSRDEMRRRCSYLLLYEISKSKKKTAPIDDYFLECVQRIQLEIHDEPNWVREAMNTALLGIGKRNAKLNRATVKAAKAIGPVHVDYGENNSCEPLDVLKHLTNESLKKRLTSS